MQPKGLKSVLKVGVFQGSKHVAKPLPDIAMQSAKHGENFSDIQGNGWPTSSIPHESKSLNLYFHAFCQDPSRASGRAS